MLNRWRKLATAAAWALGALAAVLLVRWSIWPLFGGQKLPPSVCAAVTSILMGLLLSPRTTPWPVRWRKPATAAAWALGALGAVLLVRWSIWPLFGGQKLTLRMVCAAVTSFLVVAMLSPRTIRWLVRMKLGDRPEFDHAELNELTRHKSATPTMGGILIVLAILVATYLFADMVNFYVRMAFMVVIWLAGLGAVDDWLKLRAARLARAAGADAKPTRDGLRSYQKVLFQIALAVLLSFFIHHHGKHSCFWPDADWPIGANLKEMLARGQGSAMQYFFLPIDAGPFALPVAAFVIVTVLVMVGSSNAVNLTDGMDGLAGGCMLIVAAVFLLLTWVTGVAQWACQFHLPFVPSSAELTVLCAAMIGACLGFLWFNCLPAQVFMGDTGSLPLGGLIGYVAVVTRQEMMLLIAGGIFVMEAVSVILQVGCFKMTGGQRIFRCSPIHHHFHLLGWAESKVVVRFWLLGLMFAAVAVATLTLR
ncbi:MAG TPA: phospho-N-acetylmuramoyl-pentapeptide-transferase [Phycisphaerae bacterium]|nr:phospho-N-acetylmuramoyl-pentapeptide-transferase [Phycisphaerae bacterium]